jgi:2-keto-4-pentenoate hydratase/2-oxohepta-3-ene-1,7-dioic acid hydratase in catechol pathway
MRFVTFTSGDAPCLGLLLGPDAVFDLTAAAGADARLGSMLSLIDAGPDGLAAAEHWLQRASDDATLAMHRHRLGQVRLLAPIPRPRKNVYCVGLNYRSHVEQNAAALGQPVEIPEIPLFFSKPVTAVIGPGEQIRLDKRLTRKLDYEVELTMVIGRRGTWIPREQASDHIFGYTIANDVSARDLQFRTSQFLYGKGLDTYCPLGPCIVTPDELGDLGAVNVELYVNGEQRQHESAGNMLFPPEVVIATLSQGITLEPGDLITLGTPGGCGYQLIPPQFLQPGDIVDCRIDGIGGLINPVADAQTITTP